MQIPADLQQFCQCRKDVPTNADMHRPCGKVARLSIIAKVQACSRLAGRWQTCLAFAKTCRPAVGLRI